MQLDGADFALRAAEALRDVLPQLMFVTSPSGATTYVNRPWLDYTALSSEVALSDGWLAAVDPMMRDSAHARWEAAIAAPRALYEARLRMRRGSDGAYRWFLCRASPVREDDGHVSMFVGTCTDVDEHARDAERQRTLSEASRALATTAGLDARLAAVARATLPALGDWCAVLLLNDERKPCIRALAHRDPATDVRVQSLVGGIATIDPMGESPTSRLLRGEVERVLVPVVDEEALERYVPPALRKILRELGFASLLAVPIVARGSVLGAIMLAAAEASIVHAPADVDTAEELARRVSLSIDNARALEEINDKAERLRFIAEASRALGESLDLGATLTKLLKMLVPRLADWAVLHIAQPSGELVPIAAQHRERAGDEALASIVRVPGGSAWDVGASAAVGSGRPYLEVHAGEAARLTLRGGAGDPERAPTVFFRARASVPLRAHGKIYGAVTVARVDGAGYGPADLDLFEEIAQRAALAVANANDYEREHNVSTVLQNALLPASLPPDGDFSFRAVYHPGQSEAQVGGDWYDAMRLYDGRIVVSIGDVSGSGLSAAVTMASMRQIIRGIAQVQADPALMLDAADKVLRSDAPDRFVTAFVGVLDPVTLDFTYASAGHPPPFLRHANGAIEALRAPALPLGLRRPMEGGTQTRQLDEGSVLVFYTDGLTEATRDPIEGEARLHDALSDPTITNAEGLAEALYRRLLRAGSRDDVAIMTVSARTAEVAPPEERDRFSMRFDLSDAEQAHHARRAFLERITASGVTGESLDATELIVGELLGNVVRHAPGRAEVVFDRQHDAIVVHVIDRGHGFDVAPALPRDAFSEHGRGLFLISRLASDFQITRRPEDGSHARVVLAMESGPAGRPTSADKNEDARLL